MTDREGKDFVVDLPDRLRLHAQFWPSIQITISAENARRLADDLERGITYRPGAVIEGMAEPVEAEPAKTNILQRAAKYVLTKYRWCGKVSM